MNKKRLAVGIIAMCSVPFMFAGGILTNTNQSARFARLMALEASTNVDAAYYNPAGLVKLQDGFHFSFSNQSVYQTRVINSTYAPFAQSGGDPTKTYKGTASAPIVPSLQAAYKKGKWVLSGSLAVVGGGGKATFSNGLPMFEAGASALPGIFSQVAAGLNNKLGTSGTISSNRYSVDQYMSGSSFIYGAQMGGTYQINEIFSAYAGFRLNIVNNHYEGYLRSLRANIKAEGFPPGLMDYDGSSMVSPAAILGMAMQGQTDQSTINSLNLLQQASLDGAYLDSKQSGWGVAPIIGFNINYQKLNVGMKYEFKTSLNVENKTKVDDTGLDGTGMFAHGVNTAHDIPALFTIGASYAILPQLTANVGYHHFFDKSARMEGDKQKLLEGGTNEYLGGLEYQIDKMFLVSAGGQITRYGVTDEYQRDLSFSLNSYSLGFGGAVNVSEKVQINIGYFWTTYSDWTKKTGNDNPALIRTDVYSRTNKVFAAGVDFSF
ncbi:aromatic hydrocarbon degradation protein [Dysgonomonas sp. ZJ279]|uniref:aromatic hydrocarbon degradation protein n=1 Tax=Dysgonomonas sp. ZJ279 TaxID=2709796 RepID=UPI0013EBBE46|nr:aromatic hydrocarbon degradation protein [Dysgonomonas sp. ZJ279]